MLLAILIASDLSARDSVERDQVAPVMIDIGVFYTSAARRHLGGTAEIEAEIDLMLAVTNQAFLDSGAVVQYSLVGTQRVDFDEYRSAFLDFWYFVGTHDGYMDGIHDVREEWGADIVVLISRSTGACGIASSAVRVDRAFALVRAGCGASTFAHEVGHVMGLEHDWHQCGTNCEGRSIYSRGYVNQRAFRESAPESSRWRTIMAYDSQCSRAGFSCPEIMRFSNPDQTYLGDPLGVGGTRRTQEVQGPADAVRTLNETREIVANYRSRSETPDPPEVSITSPSSPVTEGESAEFSVTLSPAAAGALTVSVSVTESGAMLSGTPPASVSFADGDASATLSVPTAADEVVEAHSTVTATVTAGTGYTVGSRSSATVAVEDDDIVPVVPLTASFVSLPDGHAGSGTVDLGIRFSEPISTSYRTLRDASFQVTNGEVVNARRVGGRSDVWNIVIAPLSDAPLIVVLPATADCGAAGAVCTADGKPLSNRLEVTLPAGAEPQLPTVSIRALASRVSEGELAAFRLSRTGPTTEELTLRVSTEMSKRGPVEMPVGIRAGQRDQVSYAGAHDNTVVEADLTARWTIVEDDSYLVWEEAASAEVVLVENDVAEFALSVDSAELVEGGSTTVRIEITNGVTFAEDQTITLDFAGSTATEGTDFTVAPSSRRTLPAGERSVTATLTAAGDAEEEDEETVAITASHDGATIGRVTVTILSTDTEPLTARFLEMPETHDGETPFTFELLFSEDIKISYVTLRDAAFEVTGGAVKRARRLARPSNLRWEITVEPGSDGNVSLVLPPTEDCAAAGAVCTREGKPLSSRPTAVVRGPTSGSLAQGFALAPANARPSGIWSDGETAWVADVDDATLYAYRLSDGVRRPERDIVTEPEPMGLWSDGQTLWVAVLDGGLRAHRLSDGSRLVGQDLGLEADAKSVGVWSDGETAWVSNWLDGTVRAYRLSDGARVAGRDITLDVKNLLPGGLSSDGETLWVADWQEQIYAYRPSSGERIPDRDIRVGAPDEDPSGLWSSGGRLLTTGWKSRKVRAYRPPEAVPAAIPSGLSAVVDPALQARIAAVLGKAPGEAVSTAELAELRELDVRNGAVADLAGLENAVNLKDLNLGFNPVVDLRPLALLPKLESLNLDGVGTDLRTLSSLSGIRRLSVRHSGVEDLRPLARLRSLTELDVGDNRIDDLSPLVTLTRLAVLRADRNRIANLSPLRGMVSLKELDIGFNPLEDPWQLALLPALESLNLDGATPDPVALASLPGLHRLSLRHNGIDDLGPLAGLTSLIELDVGDNRIEDLHSLTGLTGLVRLRADRNRIGNLSSLASLAGLETLDLTANRVRDVQALAGLGRLRTLHLGNNPVREISPLSGLERLGELGLAENVVGELRSLSGLTGLRRLDLRGSAARDLRPLRALPSLVWVHVGGSRIEDLTPLGGRTGLAVFGRDDREAPGGTGHARRPSGR